VQQLKGGVTACAIFVALTIMASGTAARADARADIKALEERFVAAFKAKDVNAIMKVYEPSRALVVFDVIPPRQYVGAAAYRKDWQSFLDSFSGPITVELNDLDIGADRNLAYSHSIQHLTGTDKGGKKLDLTVRVTDVYEKIRGHWFIVHEHVSVPVDLNTDKPDLDSKP
jgi:ketosteroid isomerase-like protein